MQLLSDRVEIAEKTDEREIESRPGIVYDDEMRDGEEEEESAGGLELGLGHERVEGGVVGGAAGLTIGGSVTAVAVIAIPASREESGADSRQNGGVANRDQMKINDPLLKIDVTLNVNVPATPATAATATIFVLRRDASKSFSTDYAADERTCGTLTQIELKTINAHRRLSVRQTASNISRYLWSDTD